MKSLTAVCQTGASMPAINPNGRISRHPPHRGDGENAEMKMYLSKLKDLVPFMPKNRKLSKLEIIQHVIDYICDLQSELETHPEINNFDASAALSFATNNLDRISSESTANTTTTTTDEEMHDMEGESVSSSVQERLNAPEQQQQQQQSSPAHQNQRKPLVECQTPNTILPPATQHQQQQQQQQQQRHMNASTLVQQNGSSSLVTTTTTSSSSSSSSSSSAASVPSTTLSGDKDMNSRQSC